MIVPKLAQPITPAYLICTECDYVTYKSADMKVVCLNKDCVRYNVVFTVKLVTSAK